MAFTKTTSITKACCYTPSAVSSLNNAIAGLRPALPAQVTHDLLSGHGACFSAPPLMYTTALVPSRLLYSFSQSPLIFPTPVQFVQPKLSTQGGHRCMLTAFFLFSQYYARGPAAVPSVALDGTAASTQPNHLP